MTAAIVEKKGSNGFAALIFAVFAAAAANRAVVVEEGWKSYGVGSEIVSRMYEEAFDYVDAPIIRVAQKEVPLPYNRTLEQAALPQVPDIIAAAKEVLK